LYRQLEWEETAWTLAWEIWWFARGSPLRPRWTRRRSSNRSGSSKMILWQNYDFTFFFLKLKILRWKKGCQNSFHYVWKTAKFYLNLQLDTGTNTFVNHFRQDRFDMKIYILIFLKTSRIKSLPKFSNNFEMFFYLFFFLLCLPLNFIEVV
jgi:hypothetical protein